MIFVRWILIVTAWLLVAPETFELLLGIPVVIPERYTTSPACALIVVIGAISAFYELYRLTK